MEYTMEWLMVCIPLILLMAMPIIMENKLGIFGITNIIGVLLIMALYIFLG